MDFIKEINEYYDREKAVIDALDRDEINAAMNALLDAYDRGATVYVFGNGGSAATASHMVCDFNKGTCEKLDKKFNFVCLNDNTPTLMAVANDLSYAKDSSMKNVTTSEELVDINSSRNSASTIV